MPIKAIEAMADAVMAFEGWKLGSRSWRNRNPGNLRAIHEDDAVDADGYRIFAGLCDGYYALQDDLWTKITGSSRHNLTETSTLEDLFAIYAPRADGNAPNQYAAFVARFLTHALEREITPATELGTLGIS